METIIFKSYAKLNLFLNILNKRSDLYHELDGIMTGISIYDSIRIQKAQDFSMTCDMYSLANENNLALKAAKLFFERAKLEGGVHIFINKHIPPMSGLGGGSGNAGTSLLAMNELYGHPLSHEELLEIAIKLGADVPFFIHSHPCRAQGIGEKLTDVQNNLDVFYLIVKPAMGIDTKECFELFDTHPKAAPKGDITAAAIQRGDVVGYINSAQNMLTDCAKKLCPDIEKAIHFLKTNEAYYANMTGSGSAVFGIYIHRKAAIKALNAAKELFEFACIAKKVNSTYQPVLRIN